MYLKILVEHIINLQTCVYKTENSGANHETLQDYLYL